MSDELRICICMSVNRPHDEISKIGTWVVNTIVDGL